MGLTTNNNSTDICVEHDDMDVDFTQAWLDVTEDMTGSAPLVVAGPALTRLLVTVICLAATALSFLIIVILIYRRLRRERNKKMQVSQPSLSPLSRIY